MIKVRFIIAHRQRCLDVGYKPQDILTWGDILGTWCRSIKATEVLIGAGTEGDGFFVEAHFADEPDEDLVGDVVLRDVFKSKHPMLLEDRNPYHFKPILAAWDYNGKSHNAKYNQVAAKVKEVVEACRGIDYDEFLRRMQNRTDIIPPVIDDPDKVVL